MNLHKRIVPDLILGGTMEHLYRKFGVHIPEILLPAKGTDLTKWSVIACDQYTSQPDYWDKVNEEVGDHPSALRLTFPEIYLKDDDKDERIANINEAMLQYLNQGILEPQKPGFILVDRSTPHVASRKGLIMAVDLECYDYRESSQTLIRATEGTVLDRIPPRVKIRENAPIELPHIIVLIDDPGKTVIESLFEKKDSFDKLYDFELMQGGGHIRGWKVDDASSLSMTADALAGLAGLERPAELLNSEGGTVANDNLSIKALTAPASPDEQPCSAPLLFAMGDGNHSLASAKAHWENVKAALKLHDSSSVSEHPARYALVEVVNIHDEGLVFEPIHRVLFGIDSTTVLQNVKNICSLVFNGKSEAEYKLYSSGAAMEADLKAAQDAAAASHYSTSAAVAQHRSKAAGTAADTTPAHPPVHLLPFILEGIYGLLSISNPQSSLEVGTLQSVLDELGRSGTSIEIDYIHGEQVVTELGSKKSHMGFFLPVLSKFDFFETIRQDGIFPRKTFSLGEAEEKRYYLECRCIK